MREVHIIAEDLGVSSIKVWKIVAYFRGAQLGLLRRRGNADRRKPQGNMCLAK